jgi:transposase
VDKQRGREAHGRIGILPVFKGTGVHDAYESYWGYQEMQHGLCNVHLARDLKGLQEMYPNQSWPESMRTLLFEIYAQVKTKKAVRTLALNAEVIQAYQIRYRELVQVGLSVNPLPERIARR